MPHPVATHLVGIGEVLCFASFGGTETGELFKITVM